MSGGHEADREPPEVVRLVIWGLTGLMGVVIATMPFIFGPMFYLEPRFIISVPTLTMLLVLVYLSRKVAQPWHGEAIVWIATAAVWGFAALVLGYERQIPVPASAAIALMLGAFFMRTTAMRVLGVVTLLMTGITAYAAEAPAAVVIDWFVFMVPTVGVAMLIQRGLAHGDARRTRAEHSLAQSRDELRDLVDSTEDLMVAVDPGGVVRTCNRSAVAWGRQFLDVELAVGVRLSKVIPERHRSAYARHATEATHGRRCTWPLQQGTPRRDFELTFSPMHGEDAGFVICGREVTQTRTVAQTNAAALESARREVFNMVNHEIATPLTPILLTTSRLLKGNQEADMAAYRKAMELVERNVERVVSAVAEMIAENNRHPTEETVWDVGETPDERAKHE